MPSKLFKYGGAAGTFPRVQPLWRDDLLKRFPNRAFFERVLQLCLLVRIVGQNTCHPRDAKQAQHVQREAKQIHHEECGIAGSGRECDQPSLTGPGSTDAG